MDILALSSYVVGRFSQRSSGGITPMKLQKLLYYIKVWTLIADQELVHADFEKWDYGPVNREVYENYRSYGHSAIDVPNQVDDIEQPATALVDFILENYIRFDAFKLSAMTHAEEPWKQTPKNGVIQEELLESYYRGQNFAGNFKPFDLSNQKFYPLDSDSFTIDMDKKDAIEITTYPSYEDYKNALTEAEREFNEEWSQVLI